MFNETELRLKFLQAQDTYLLIRHINESGELAIYTEAFEFFCMCIPHCNFVYSMFTAGNFVYHI